MLVRGGVLSGSGVSTEHAITASEVERLGDDEGLGPVHLPYVGHRPWGERSLPPRSTAQAVRCLDRYSSLTRPHPKTDSLSFLQGIIARDSELRPCAICERNC